MDIPTCPNCNVELKMIFRVTTEIICKICVIEEDESGIFFREEEEVSYENVAPYALDEDLFNSMLRMWIRNRG